MIEATSWTSLQFGIEATQIVDVGEEGSVEPLDGIDVSGFSLPAVTVNSLQCTSCQCVPRDPGVYIVTRPCRTQPNFMSRSVGGWHKGQDPTDPPSLLQEHWVEGASILYVGKGGGAQGLKRLGEYMRFGMGKNVGHRGGRLIWNLENYRELLVQWMLTPDEAPQDVERRLIGHFRGMYGKRPFANLLGGG